MEGGSADGIIKCIVTRGEGKRSHDIVSKIPPKQSKINLEQQKSKRGKARILFVLSYDFF